jgi:ribonuclease E
MNQKIPKKRIIIDTVHEKNIRVATTIDGELENLDFALKDRNQVRGNIYLAKVVRIEQALQAAFVDFGVGKNGFLPFSEIHPDYYQISQEDKQDIIKQMKSDFDDGYQDDEPRQSHDDEEKNDKTILDSVKDNIAQESSYDLRKFENIIKSKRYKISDVIHKDQLLLVQVLKEERGNKGATLTTYLSLAGRFLVFMPNSLKGNGISRKIAEADERRRIKSILTSFSIPITSSVVARTAAESVPDNDLKKDCEYLLNLWNSIRDKTLKSDAPSFIHEEDNILRRAVRDYFDPQVSEIIVEGDQGYRDVKNYLHDISDSSGVNLINYYGKSPVFTRYGVEDKIAQLFNTKVNLPSGGSLVIQQTEALVAIDINSGRATNEQDIEETATKTNLEAADEIARQIRLRNLSGLIVVDFIDMMRFSNKKSIERKLRTVMAKDRVRVQVGRISQFGLLEISRQRTRPSFFELAGNPCPTCNGASFIKSLEYIALSLLRSIDSSIRDEVVKNGGSADGAVVNATQSLASYILNYKRASLYEIEKTYGVMVFIHAGKSDKDENFWITFEGQKGYNSDTNPDVIEMAGSRSMNLNINNIKQSPSNTAGMFDKILKALGLQRAVR